MTVTGALNTGVRMGLFQLPPAFVLASGTFFSKKTFPAVRGAIVRSGGTFAKFTTTISVPALLAPFESFARRQATPVYFVFRNKHYS